jgi:hypothetical protein
MQRSEEGASDQREATVECEEAHSDVRSWQHDSVTGFS